MTIKTAWRLRLRKTRTKNGIAHGYLIPAYALSKPSEIYSIRRELQCHVDPSYYSVLYVLSFGNKNEIQYERSVSTEVLNHPYGLPYEWFNFLYSDCHDVITPDDGVFIEEGRFLELIRDTQSASEWKLDFLLLQVFWIKKEKLNAS